MKVLHHFHFQVFYRLVIQVGYLLESIRLLLYSQQVFELGGASPLRTLTEVIR
jgi:hypothetical protein